MLTKIILLSIYHRWLMLFATLGVCLLGVYNLQNLAIDAVPDITNVQVQVNTAAPGYSTLEVEQRVTFPIETSLSGVPYLQSTRSVSHYGLSQVTVIFEEGTNIYFARQLLSERLQQIKDKIPPGLNPSLGPISTGLGEIYFYTVEATEDAVKEDGTKYTLMDLLTIQKWMIVPKLRSVKGVIEVNTIGGYEQQYHITPFVEQLLTYELNIQDILKAIDDNSDNVGAGYIERNGEQYLVRIPGQVKNIKDIENIILSKRDDVIIKIKNVANVTLGHPLRTGAATKNGAETVLGTVMMLIGEDSRTTAKRVDEKVNEIAKTLPPGVVIKTVYNRTNLVELTIATVKHNLFEGALLVVAILFFILGNIKAALITASVIPIAMLMTITGMVEYKVSGNLMSAIIIIDNCIRRFGLRQQEVGRLLNKDERFELVANATSEVIKPSIFGIMIITIVYFPIFTLTGVEGKMFYPMAFTVVVALLFSLVLCLTFIPAAVAVFLTGKINQNETLIMRFIKQVYKPMLEYAIKRPFSIIAYASVSVLMSIILAFNMGSEFVPSLDEGDLAIMVTRAPGTSLTQSLAMQSVLEKEILKLPEVKYVVGRIGTAEVATDASPPNISDTFVFLHSRDAWPNTKKLKSQLVQEIEDLLKNIPGSNYEFAQPIELRFNELISGVRSDLAVKIFGDNYSELLEAAEKIGNLLQNIQGATDIKIEKVTGLPMLNIVPDREKMNKYGLNIKDVQDIINTSVGGGKAGVLYDGDKRFDIVVRLSESSRKDVEILKQLPIPIAKVEKKIGFEFKPSYIPLNEIADISADFGPAQISRENAKRRIVVTANVRDRDLGSFVSDLQETIAEKITLPTGYWIEYGGTFEKMLSAKNRLMIVVPIALLLIFMLLFMAFGSISSALMVFSGIPFALTGGIAALLLRGMPFSISAGIGFIALSGVAVLNGVVMISFIRELQKNGMLLIDAIIQGAIIRLRPVVMTALVASLGFIPMAINTGAGAEVQRPLATVVIGGIISSTVLTLLVLPLLYKLFGAREKESIKNKS
jgi:cobalt-zinc-cadmium resistance protein CzcA